MDPESFINLFNSCWFNLEILRNSSNSMNSEINPDCKIQENQEPMIPITKIPSIHVRSKSDEIDQSMISLYSVSPLSPSSVLFRSDHDEEEEENQEIKKIARKKRLGKSLSELEFEELKGFEDIGFVFSEEDKDSSLVEILPGLKRLGKNQETRKNVVLVSRPYLSEAWEIVEEKRKIKNRPLMINWSGIDRNNEFDMKDSIKFWAHTVASAVR